jgi:hypothetical protein
MKNEIKICENCQALCDKLDSGYYCKACGTWFAENYNFTQWATSEPLEEITYGY